MSSAKEFLYEETCRVPILSDPSKTLALVLTVPPAVHADHFTNDLGPATNRLAVLLHGLGSHKNFGRPDDRRGRGGSGQRGGVFPVGRPPGDEVGGRADLRALTRRRGDVQLDVAAAAARQAAGVHSDQLLRPI
ncbi:hypothetical protein KL919_003183 [Ogataea angusta]|uniref:Uncharacterized protein n=1 Tax=Pichia angusta TaxID=870730 RepID=A0AAN6DFC7_PICAN|nr:uncharacterized protein KL928_003089 [Ogataea angusta]KAG7818088.1 hypothetical protein KL928_003089 [Ogataea angusta]KAG7828996.1 hypothetical protein KL920_002789 [Ogataea angusta]KAG7842502.1 hypothetical protein KL941_005166 [Ogataea angusta]KAG7859118.1 hypothetical protein KL919_003183 [Ogataea angusta]